jgi:DNA-binding transcriptional MerR regulator
MLRIGEFSSLTGISIHMLRNYDKIALLVPEHTDENSGYRYYSEKQIVIANQIQVLKVLGFGLKEIAAIQINNNSNEKIKQFISGKIDEKENELIIIKEQIKQMKQAMKDLNNEGNYALAVVIKKIPARKVASRRDILHKFQEEGRLWGELNEECRKLNVNFAVVDYSFAITHKLDLDNSYMDVEVQRVVDKLIKDTDKIKFLEIPECEAATVAFQGVYSKLADINTYVANWVKRNRYEICDLSFSTYYISPGNEANPENFITEVCFPIKKVNKYQNTY